jgi:Leucine-rich repeat (LRR) protein
MDNLNMDNTHVIEQLPIPKIEKEVLLKFTHRLVPIDDWGEYANATKGGNYFTVRIIDGHVKEIKFYMTINHDPIYFNPVLSLPSNFVNLTLLESVFLENLDLKTPEILVKITTLKKIQFIDFLSNFPDLFSNLINLEEIFLSNSYIHPDYPSFLPPYFQNYKKLKKLTLGSDRIKNLPEYLADFPDLVKLSLFMDISEFPEVILRNSRLKNLKISQSQIIAIPPLLSNLDLEDLDLADNQIQLFPASLGNMHNLIKLDLSNNPIQNKSLDWIVNLNKLEDLSLFRLELTEIPKDLKKLSQLKKLNLSYNNITNMSEIFNNFSQLVELFIGGNPIKRIHFPIIWNNLSFLHCQYCGLKDIHNIIEMCPNLKKLDLSRNEFSSIPVTIKQLKNLEKLDLSESKIKKFPEELINVINLRHIQLNGSQIEEIPIFEEKMSQLEDLEIGYSQLKAGKCNFKSFPNLKVLDINDHDLELFPESIQTLESLKVLKMYKCNLKNIPKWIGKLEKIEYIDLHENEIEEIPLELFNLKNLKYIDLSKNNIQVLPPEIALLNKLEEIYLQHNDISALPNSLNELEHLLYVNIEKNKKLQKRDNWMTNSKSEFLTFSIDE